MGQQQVLQAWDVLHIRTIFTDFSHHQSEQQDSFFQTFFSLLAGSVNLLIGFWGGVFFLAFHTFTKCTCIAGNLMLWLKFAAKEIVANATTRKSRCMHALHRVTTCVELNAPLLELDALSWMLQPWKWMPHLELDARKAATCLNHTSSSCHVDRRNGYHKA